MTTTGDLRLRHIVEQTAMELTDSDGRFNKSDLTDAVREKLARDDLDPYIKAAAMDKLAQSTVTSFGEHRNPRRRRNGSLFHPDDVLKLGNGIWVWMGRATDSDVVGWSRQSRRNRTRVDLADSEIQDYADERIDAFRTHSDVIHLEQLERVAFGWSADDAHHAGLLWL